MFWPCRQLLPVFALTVFATAQAADDAFVDGKPVPDFHVNGIKSILTRASLVGRPSIIVVVGKSMATSYMRSIFTQAKLLSKNFGDEINILVAVNESKLNPNGDSSPAGIVARLNAVMDLTEDPIRLDDLPKFQVAINTALRTPEGKLNESIPCRGLPHTYILDKKGTIVSSLSGKLAEGKDPETGRTWWGNYTARELWKLQGRQDLLRAEATRISQLLERQPELEPDLWLNKLHALAVVDAIAANRYFFRVGETLYKDDPNGQIKLCWKMINRPLFPNADYKRAISFAERAIERVEKDTPEFVTALDMIAMLYYMSEQYDKAIELIDKAAALGNSVEGVTDKAKTDMKAKQDLFRKVKNGYRGG